jgi:16S rRNA (cytosine967-C5)-methyltransferase
MMNARITAARVLWRVIGQGESLTAALPAEIQRPGHEQNQALVKELCFGTLRWFDRLNVVLRQLLRKPLKPRDLDVECLLKLGLYQLIYMHKPPYAIVQNTVQAGEGLGKVWAKGLINATLRSFLRQREALLERADRDPVAKYSHPQWLLSRLQSAYPHAWQRICEAANRRAPMTLRLNLQRIDRDTYLAQLRKAGLPGEPHPKVKSAVSLLNAMDVNEVPGFQEGNVTVQDAAAQLAAPLLKCERGMRVLDACAAPGGKTGHILEYVGDDVKLVALDIDPSRLQRLQHTLHRLRLSASLCLGDAVNPDSWWDGVVFDRILLDAPCSATGVIRRHPDIKQLRKPKDIAALQIQQRKLICALWSLLAKGGMLLYVTCSILPQENRQLIQWVRGIYADAINVSPEMEWARTDSQGWQILPGEMDMDGFFYACLQKV